MIAVTPEPIIAPEGYVQFAPNNSAEGREPVAYLWVKAKPQEGTTCPTCGFAGHEIFKPSMPLWAQQRTQGITAWICDNPECWRGGKFIE